MLNADGQHPAEGLEIPIIEAQAAAADVDRRLRSDYEFFAEFFLAEELTLAIPEFHVQIWDMMTQEHGKDACVIAVPREHAKTTQAKLAVVRYFMFTKHRFCVYLSNTNPIATNACKDIFEFFHTANYESVYGPVEVIKASEGFSLWIFKLRSLDGKVKTCILRAMGANQQMRGINIDNKRPDIAVVDDVEDLENTESKALQKKLDRWIFATFFKALAHKRRIIWIGNMLRKTSLLARLVKEEAFKSTWDTLVLGALVRSVDSTGLVPLWPELWTVEKLQDDFAQYQAIRQTESWFCEMMNMPGQGEAGFQPSDMHYVQTRLPEEYLATFLTIDPAFGLDEDRNDCTAIVLHGIPKDGPPHVISYEVGHYVESMIFEIAMKYRRTWNALTWGVESVAAQKVLLTLFEIMLLRRQEHQVVILPLKADTHESKHMRIIAFVNLMKSHEYALPYGDVHATNQFMEYDLGLKNQKDDLVDACAYGPQMLHFHRHTIIRQAQQALYGESAVAKLQYGSEVASV